MKGTTIPESLVEDIQNEECIVFLGAGASTEGVPNTKKLVDVLIERCNFPSTLPPILPKVAQYFCDTLDAGLKGRLTREIRHYMDYFMEHGEANNFATMVHDIIAKIGLFKIIITTNWDVFMERELNLLPIVRDSDLVYWDDNKRQVIKLHGCISQPETIIVTEEDYNDFIEKEFGSLICNKIKDLMATKTFLFLGYSLKDESFQIIHNKVLSKLGKFSRSSYAVLRDPTKEDIKLLKKRAVKVISSTAVAFLRDLHKIYIEKDIYFDNGFFSELSICIRLLHMTHFSTGQEDDIGLVSMMYQDGLQHSLQDLYYGIAKGKPKSYYRDELKFFSNKLEEELKKGDPIEISYLRGRIEALKWALDPKEELKMYLSLDLEPINEKEFLKLRKSLKKQNKKNM